MKKGDTVIFKDPARISSFAAIGGKRESEGPLHDKFDLLLTDTKCGQPTWEMAETVFQRTLIETLLRKSGSSLSTISCVLSGDLQCQCTASSYTMRSIDAPHIGLYGACSTMAESIGIGACLVAGGCMPRVISLASSHFCTAERQYRTPLDYGGKRTPTSQWTVTGAGGVIIDQSTSKGVMIRSATFGRVTDYGVTDINNMGAAMAPAAVQTLLRYFKASGENPSSFDKIYTGDLGFVGSLLFNDLMENEGVKLKNHQDCGVIIYDRENQDVQAGASGAGCSACVLSCEILPALARGSLSRVLFISTGALMSQATSLQGESIPCVAHMVELSAEGSDNI